jgi:type IX secretion system PorP/SprF family membrane protein
VRKLTFILICLLTGSLASGQQLPIYSQYLYNKFMLNPAVAGSDGYTSFNMTAREQWVGYTGAPRTFSFSAQSRLLKRSYILKDSKLKKDVFRPKSDGRVGLGAYVFSDRNGLIQRTGFQATYAYHLWLRNSTQFSMGLAFTGYHFKIDETQIDFEDPNEPWLNDELRRGMFVPDMAFGAYLQNQRYSAGFSVEQLFEGAAKIADATYDNYQMERHYYMFGTYSFESGSKTELQPSILIVMSEQLKPMADIGFTYIYDQNIWAGLSYRTAGAIIANVGFKYERFYFGYAFDFTLSEIQKVTYGTHEITLALKLGDNTRRYRWQDRY